jgi:tryptophan-rich sensory protein
LKKFPWKTYAAWILLTEAVGALSGYITREGTEIYNMTVQKPPLTPPGAVFPIVWGILFALLGIGAARIYLAPATGIRYKSLLVFFVQLVFNFIWSIIFFNYQAFGFAFVWLIVLWLLILAMIGLFRKTDKPAGLLQIPYLLWVSFAAYLNFGVWLLN